MKEKIMMISRYLHPLFERILFFWVRTDIHREAVEWTKPPSQPVLYIIEKNSWSDRWVLNHVCKKVHFPLVNQKPLKINNVSGSLYPLTRKFSFKALLDQKYNPFQTFDDLQNHLLNDPQNDVLLVPVSIFWGRPIEKQKNWFGMLLSDSMQLVGSFRKFLTILIHGRDTAVIFSKPLSLRDATRKQNHNSEDLHQLLSNILKQQRRATFGPVMSTHQQMITDIIQSPVIQQEIERQHIEDKTAIKTLTKNAYNYCQEILSNTTQISQEIMKRLLNFFWHRNFSGIQVLDIEPVKKIALTHQLVYVPCHRSHVDYLLLSYVLFKEGLALPYIAAGDNLNMPIIGKLLKGGGAFFIRRSFRDKPLYSKILHEYIHQLMKIGTPIEYFVEGGRSRTGRLLKPKLGMLSMTIEAWFKTQNRPIAFIPVYIGYEKIMESEAYIREMSGLKKKKESLIGSITSIINLKGQYGQVTARFGTPIDLVKDLPGDKNNMDVDSASLGLRKEPWFRTLVQSTADKIMSNINHAAVVNPINLISTCLLSTQKLSMDQIDLIDQCQFYQNLLTHLSFLNKILVQGDITHDTMTQTQEQQLISIQSHEMGDIVYLTYKQSIRLGYYRNNTLHALIVLSLVAGSFSHVRRLHRDKLFNLLAYIYPFIQSELQLPWHKDELNQILREILDYFIQQNLLKEVEGYLLRPDRNDKNFLYLIRLGRISQPILERYYMTFIVLWDNTNTPSDESQLEQKCHLIAQKISILYGENSPDFFDRRLFRDFITTMIDCGYIEKNTQDHLIFTQTLEQINLDIRLLLSSEIRNAILQVLRPNLTQTDDKITK